MYRPGLAGLHTAGWPIQSRPGRRAAPHVWMESGEAAVGSQVNWKGKSVHMRKEGFPGPATVTNLERPVQEVGRRWRIWSQRIKETPRRASFNKPLFNTWVGEWVWGLSGDRAGGETGKGAEMDRGEWTWGSKTDQEMKPAGVRKPPLFSCF